MGRSTKPRIKIADILPEEHQDFLFYCSLCGKRYSDEITSTDYVTYSSEFDKDPSSVGRLSEIITGISFVKPMRAENSTASIESVLEVWNSEASNLKEPHRTEIHAILNKAGEPTYGERLSVDSKDFSEIPLENLKPVYPYAVRSINCLMRSNFRTLEQLFNLTPSRLRSTNGLGEKLAGEIETFLAEAAGKNTTTVTCEE